MIDDYVTHNFPSVTGKGTIPADTNLPDKEKFEDYVAVPHPEGYQLGGIWLETFHSQIGRIIRGTRRERQPVPINRKFEIVTPERVRWLTGINLVVDNSIVGEVGVHVANMESVAEMYALEVPPDYYGCHQERLSRKNAPHKDPLTFVDEESVWGAVTNFWKRLKEASQPVYLTATYGNHIRIEPKINGERYIVHVYPAPPPEKVTVH